MNILANQVAAAAATAAAEAELASVKQHLQQGFGLIKKLKEQIAAAGPSPSQLAAQFTESLGSLSSSMTDIAARSAAPCANPPVQPRRT